MRSVINLVRFLPPLCAAHKKADPKVEDSAEDAEDAASRVKLYLLQPMCHTPLGCKDKGFGFALFLHPFPSYALGAAVTKQLEYVDAMQHSSNCISIANSSKAKGERRCSL